MDIAGERQLQPLPRRAIGVGDVEFILIIAETGWRILSADDCAVFVRLHNTIDDVGASRDRNGARESANRDLP